MVGENIVPLNVVIRVLESNEQKQKERLFPESFFVKIKGLATLLPSEIAYSEMAYLYYKQHGY